MSSHSGASGAEGVDWRENIKRQLAAALERRARAAEQQARLSETLPEVEEGQRQIKKRLEILPPPIGDKALREKLKVPERVFENARHKLFLILTDPTSIPEMRRRAERSYTEARNDLLFMAVRHYQSEAPIQEDGSRGVKYQDEMNRLYGEFIQNERTFFAKETPVKIDTVYTLALEPVLMQAFAVQMLGEYGVEDTAEANARKAVIESTLNPETVNADLAQLETPLTTAESRVLREARLAYVSSKIAAAEGAPHVDARAVEKRYHELRADALMQIRKMKESTEEDNEWVDELIHKAQRTDMQLELALHAVKLSPEKQKRVSKLGAKLSKMKWGRNTLALLALFAAVSRDAPDVDVTPMHGGAPTEDVQTPRAQASAPDEQQSSVIPPTLFEGNRLVEEGQGITITIPENGNALSALREVVIASSRIPWVTAWMEKVHREARPDLVVTREGRLEALAMDAGFMTEYDELDSATGAYVSRSAPIPPGSVLVLDQTGMRFRYPDGTEQLLVNGDTLESNPLAAQ